MTTRWLARRTLLWKLTAGLVLLLLATCTLVGVVTALSLHGFLIGRLDTQLRQASGRFTESVDNDHDRGLVSGPDGDADNSVPGQSVGTFGARLVNGRITDAAIVLANGNAQQLMLGDDDIGGLVSLPADGSIHTLGIEHLGDYRVIAEADPDGDGEVQLTGLPLAPVEETVQRLLVIEGGVFAVIVIGGAAASMLLVKLTLRPLNRVAAAALDVSQLPLSSGQVDLPRGDSTLPPQTEVGQVSAAFDHMIDHVETALRARDSTEQRLRRFIADASHELRTPLATIRSHAEFARRSGYAIADPIKHALSRVEAESIRMGILVDDLLLLAELDAGRPLAREAVDVSRLVLDTLSDVRRAGSDHRWRLDLPEEVVETVGDAHRLQQVVTNLLANALTHTPAGTTVSARVLRDRSTVIIEVSDDGPGVPERLVPTLFERFSRADVARSRATGNTGLGLAIAHGIVSAHGGTLTVESRAGDTTFRIRLPDPPVR